MELKTIIFFSIIALIIAITIYIIKRIALVGDVASPGGVFNSKAIHVDTANGILYSDFNKTVYRFGWFTTRLVDTFIMDSNPSALFVSVDRIAWIANERMDYVSALNLFTGIETKFPTGIMPCSMVYDGRYLWVVNKGSNTVCSVDVTGLLINPPINVGYVPVSITFDGGNTLFVALAGEKAIALLSITRQGEVQKKIKVGDDLNYPVKVFCFSGQVWILCQAGLVQRFTFNPKVKAYELITCFRMPEGIIYTDICVDINKILVGDMTGKVTIFNKTDNDFYILETISTGGPVKSIHVEDLTDFYILTQEKDKSCKLYKYVFRNRIPFIFKAS